jgi:hypothetical protein
LALESEEQLDWSVFLFISIENISNSLSLNFGMAFVLSQSIQDLADLGFVERMRTQQLSIQMCHIL